jgi:hypothetical protein
MCPCCAATHPRLPAVVTASILAGYTAGVPVVVTVRANEASALVNVEPMTGIETRVFSLGSCFSWMHSPGTSARSPTRCGSRTLGQRGERVGDLAVAARDGLLIEQAGSRGGVT